MLSVEVTLFRNEKWKEFEDVVHVYIYLDPIPEHIGLKFCSKDGVKYSYFTMVSILSQITWGFCKVYNLK